MTALTIKSPRDVCKTKDNPFSYIPLDVLELLWFCDGPLKNCNKKDIQCFIGFESRTSKIESNNEPEYRDIVCAISLKKPICLTEELSPNESFYYSDYSELTSIQRGVFIRWLQDIDQKCDINVFLAFMAHLRESSRWIPSKRERVCDMLIRLINHHGYLYRAISDCYTLLLDTYFFMGDYNKLFSTFSECYSKNLYATFEKFLVYKDYLNLSLTPKELMRVISTLSGQKDSQRDIAKHPELYEESLKETIKHFFDSEDYSTRMHRKDAVEVSCEYMSEGGEKEIKLYWIDTSKSFKDNLEVMAKHTHELVKQKLHQK